MTGENCAVLPGWVPGMVATLPRIWRSCCHHLVESRRGRAVAHSRPNARGSWSSANAGGASMLRPARSGCRARRGGTGPTATARTGPARSSGSCPHSTGLRCVRSARGSYPRTSACRSPISIAPALEDVRSRAGWVGRHRRSHVSCVATQPRPRGIARSRRNAMRPRVEPVIIAVGSIRMPSCDAWSATCCRNGGARSRSAGTCANDSPTTDRCGCARRASTRRFTSPDRR